MRMIPSTKLEAMRPWSAGTDRPKTGGRRWTQRNHYKEIKKTSEKTRLSPIMVDEISSASSRSVAARVNGCRFAFQRDVG